MSTSVAIAQGYEYHIKYSSKKNGTQEKIRIKYLHKLKNVKNVKNDQCIHLLKWTKQMLIHLSDISKISGRLFQSMSLNGS